MNNGDLIRAAEAEFDVLVTTDQNLRHQQNLVGIRLAIAVFPFASWPRLQKRVLDIAAAIDAIQPGQYVELTRD